MLQQRLVWLGISLSLGLTGCSLLGLNPVSSQTPRPSLSVYASMPASNAVSIMSMADKRYVGTIAVGQGPANIVVNPRPDKEYLYSANENDGTVSFVNVRSGAQEQAIQAGARPWGIDVTPYTGSVQYLYVANQADHTAVRINVDTRAIDHTYSLPAPFTPHAVVCVPTNPSVAQKSQNLDAYIISNTQNASGSSGGCEVTKIPGDGSALASIVITGSKQLWKAAITPDGSAMYITDRGTNFLWKVKLSGTFASDGQIDVGGAAEDVAISPLGKTAYVSIPVGSGDSASGAMAVVNLANALVDITFKINSEPMNTVSQPRAVAVNSTGTELWVAMQNRLGFFGSLKDNTKPGGLSIVPYTSDPGQAPPISDIAMGAGIQN